MRRERTIPVPSGCPAHLLARMDRLFMLQREANGLSGLLGVHVWLCGSALRDDNPDARDWDVRLLLPKPQFELRYGPVAEWVEQGETGLWERTKWRWSDDCVKITKKWCKRTNLNVDLQIYPMPMWLTHKGKPKMRLDTRWADLPA